MLLILLRKLPGLALEIVVRKEKHLISQQKHMLWVLKRTVSMRRFF